MYYTLFLYTHTHTHTFSLPPNLVIGRLAFRWTLVMGGLYYIDV